MSQRRHRYCDELKVEPYVAASMRRFAHRTLSALVAMTLVSLQAIALAEDTPPSDSAAAQTSASTNIVAGSTKNIQVQWPERSFGYVLGDVIVQRVLFDSDSAPALLEPIPLTRLGKWLERQSAQLEIDSSSQHWLKVTYQIVNSPTAVINDTLPEMRITLSDGAELTLPEWPYSLGPITPESTDNVQPQFFLQPDRLPLLVDSSKATRWLRHATGALAVTLLAWLMWWLWRQHQDKVRLPFAKARYTINKLERSTSADDPAAWIALHEALNQHAGKTVQSATVSDLVALTPWLHPLQSQLEQFYQASGAKFFEQPPRAQNFALRELSEALFQAEKRHSR